MSAEDITNLTYNQIAVSYADRYWNSTLGDTLNQFAALVKPGGKIVDLGCGPGRDVAIFQQRGFNALGVDRSAGMLTEARRRVGEQFVCADMRHLPLAAASTDGIWMCASLLHIPRVDVPAILHEAQRILRLQGALYISVREGIGEEWSESDGGRRFFTLFQADELLGFVKRAKFAIQKHSVEAFGHSRWINILAVRDE
jgi:ubiquinone/menaquinone biosynthesis C-methylase UbiE